MKNRQTYPRRIETQYPMPEPVIADAVVTEAPYLADASGGEDATERIRMALADAEAMGGGTVFLPVGRYRVTGSIRIPPFCALVGDWGDPRTENGYGTVIVADVPSADAPHPALFDISGSAGVIGLTVYYPNQSLTCPMPYPFTFYCRGGMLASIQRCTVLNGYRGLGACVTEHNAHEQLTIEALYGTFLCEGAEVYDQSDVGTWKDVEISPRFWAEAAGKIDGFPSPGAEEIRAYTLANTVGLRLGDLEWTEFAGLSLSDCRIGMHIVKGHRIEFAGSVYQAQILRCGIGLLVDAIDERWGMVLANSVLEGSEAAVAHHAGGVVKMANVKLRGVVTGAGEILVNTVSDLPDLTKLPAFDRAPQSKSSALYVFEPIEGEADAADRLQALLTLAGQNGGIVYLPSGFYRISHPISVPANVTLRGSAVPIRGQGVPRGSVLLTDLSGDAASEALITLAGKRAAIVGIQIVWHRNGPHVCHTTPYAIRGRGEEVACVNCCIVASSGGVDFRGCDRHLIKKLTCCCYENAIVSGGEDGCIEGCLQNGTAIVRMHAPDLAGWVAEARIFEELFPITRLGVLPSVSDESGRIDGDAETHAQPIFAGSGYAAVGQYRGCVFLRLEGAKRETVINTFAYGVGSLLLAAESEQVFLCNLGADNIAHPQMLFRDCEVLGVNVMRYNGSSYEVADGTAKISLVNRLSIWEKHEADLSVTR